MLLVVVSACYLMYWCTISQGNYSVVKSKLFDQLEGNVLMHIILVKHLALQCVHVV